MIEAGKTYDLIKMTRWGKKFRVDKVSKHGVVCGRFIGSIWGSQGACIKLNEFKEMIKDETLLNH